MVAFVENAAALDDAGTTVPAAFKATVGTGAAGSNVAGYLTGIVDNGKLKGGESGRAISLSGSTTGETVAGGFIGRKQESLF